ncbi:uncharacterized protein LOC106172003 [Lingula anatina]|uniref:Uncharacterized protein LOC106172003 n=1 Tax=Lingula anatina TaxID=7574 RepID=A0A1S3JC95_LINAN|nr:uncharacterized protein LOC106172003 [Lingula anatina]|eukprot:XP_013408030.1 uncharacterized protein LOC106172003 [Lingula anatina]
MAEDDDVPPLEDMSELLQRVDELREFKSKSNTAQIQPNVLSQREQIIEKENIHKSNQKKPETNAFGHASSHEKKSVSKDAGGFGGFKKGFLFGGSPDTKSKPKQSTTNDSKTVNNDTTNDSIPYLKPKETKEKEYEIPEVQTAMKSAESLLQNKDWITDDLLGKVENNEVLFKRLSDPSFTKALTEFQTNPQAAMLKYKDNQEVQQFFKEFCGLLGDHFSNMPDGQPQKPKTDTISTTMPSQGADISVRSSTNPNQPTAADEKKMQEILSDPEIRFVLLDPFIQQLFETLRKDPEKGQRMLSTAQPAQQEKIQKLVDAGLLAFQR